MSIMSGGSCAKSVSMLLHPDDGEAMPKAVHWPEGPPGHPLWGHIPEFRTDPMSLLTRCAREYGDFVPLRFGPTRMVFVNDPKDLEYVFVTHNRDFVKSIMFRAFRPFGGNGIFLSEGEFW